MTADWAELSPNCAVGSEHSSNCLHYPDLEKQQNGACSESRLGVFITS